MYTDYVERVGNYIYVTISEVTDEDDALVFLMANHDYGEPEYIDYYPAEDKVIAKFPII